MLLLDAVGLLHHFFSAHDDGKGRLQIAAAPRKAITRLKKTPQKSINHGFSVEPLGVNKCDSSLAFVRLLFLFSRGFSVVSISS